MNERRVRVAGRQLYGRSSQPVRTLSKRWRPRLNLWQRRLIILVVVVAVAVWWFLHLFAVTTVTVTASSQVGELTSQVKQLMKQSLSMGNLLTLNAGQLGSKLQQAQPDIRSASVSRKWPHTVAVTVVFKQPSLGWSTGEQHYLLDSDGTVIGAFPSGDNLPTVVDTSNLPVRPGQVVVSPHFVTFAGELVPALKPLGYSVTGMSIKDTTLDLTVSTNKGYQLIFDTSRDVSSEVSDLKAVQALLVSQHAVPAAYIDLRTSGKAYYK